MSNVEHKGRFMAELSGERVEEPYAQAKTLEERVDCLEQSLQHTQELLRKLVMMLEDRFGEDIDDDGHIGSRIL